MERYLQSQEMTVYSYINRKGMRIEIKIEMEMELKIIDS